MLDLSYNKTKKIQNIDHLVGLTKLFLINNRISKIENLSSLVNITMLELGSNRIRVSMPHNSTFFVYSDGAKVTKLLVHLPKKS